MNLTQDEKEDLFILMSSPGWATLKKVMLAQKERFEKRVLSYSLTDGPEGLVIEKARAEGARSAIDGLIEMRNKEIKNA